MRLFVGVAFLAAITICGTSRADSPNDLLRASLIRVETEAEAQKLYDRLVAYKGRDLQTAFGLFAKLYSKDLGTKGVNGDLGYFFRDGGDFEVAFLAFSIPVGQISKPTWTTAGWILVYVVDKRSELEQLDDLSKRVPIRIGANWRPVSSSAEGVVFLDYRSIRKERDRYISAWFLRSMIRGSVGVTGQVAFAEKQLAWIDCEREAIGLKQRVFYGDQFVTSGIVANQSFLEKAVLESIDRTVPGSVGEAMVRATCALKPK